MEVSPNIGRPHHQWQSPFFRKLPLELRYIVYGMLLGQKWVYMSTQIWSREVHVVGRFSEYTEKSVPPFSDRSIIANLRIIPTLQICRRIYLEAIDVLYQENCFVIDTKSSVRGLMASFGSPDRLHVITSLGLACPLDFTLYAGRNPTSINGDVRRWSQKLENSCSYAKAPNNNIRHIKIYSEFNTSTEYWEATQCSLTNALATIKDRLGFESFRCYFFIKLHERNEYGAYICYEWSENDEEQHFLNSKRLSLTSQEFSKVLAADIQCRLAAV